MMLSACPSLYPFHIPYFMTQEDIIIFVIIGNVIVYQKRLGNQLFLV